MAFFSTPGIEWLYSGVTMMTPSAFAIASAMRGHDRRKAFVLHVVVVERESRRPSRSGSIVTPSGASAGRARAIAALKEPLRRLPTMTTK